MVAFARLRERPDRSLRNRLVEDHRWLAEVCARRLSRRGEPLDDLTQVAFLGLVKAVDRSTRIWCALQGLRLQDDARRVTPPLPGPHLGVEGPPADEGSLCQRGRLWWIASPNGSAGLRRSPISPASSASGRTKSSRR